MKIESYLAQRQTIINRALDRALPTGRVFPGEIHQAMRYSVLGNGKRIRPILALAACEAVGGSIRSALPAACALELIHAYSLVHDDLPAMDNADLRRGKPATHKRYGEALGVLAGDALLTYGFELLTQGNRNPSMRLSLIREVARAIGTGGMIGGQVADIRMTNGRRSSRIIETINALKTAALISAAVRVGALAGEASPETYRRLSRYGDKIGRVFQLVDDLQDNDGAVMIYGEEKTRRKAEGLTRSAVFELKPLGKKAQPLRELASFILNRSS